MAAALRPSPRAGRSPAPAGRRAEFRAGARAAAPLVVGLAPFALLVGAAVGGSTDVLAAWTGTLLVYGGSAQLTLLQMLRDGAAAWTAVLVTVLVNARLAVYSTSLAPVFAGAPLRWKVLAAATVVEPTWAVAERRAREPTDPVGARVHYAGAAVAMTVGWLAVVTVGSVVGRVDGLATHLAVAVPLCLLALVVPHVRRPGGLAAVVAAVVTALAARPLLPGADVLLAMAAAGIAGSVVSRRRS
ncbi:AzlC family ABC transporter permease [Geodermatophilus sp. YIM 151500]|uniref:AzlC family ABC transporter permease n=1 Tax=Geodermatophilus sp. YIM 151500 TaxID=2984531 RepID=UPI0021E3AC63|nr:AzlC family ABC transporter permease [Geodermatophilus sp. YIM 151500]MCV2491281.1 AzlC family ABC transporter permease [Geodermatophilus sp. YIM 151500]